MEKASCSRTKRLQEVFCYARKIQLHLGIREGNTETSQPLHPEPELPLDEENSARLNGRHIRPATGTRTYNEKGGPAART